MKKTALKFLQSIVDSEYKIFKSGSEESIMANRFGKNFFCVFKDKQELEDYFVYCCENKETP